MHKVMPHTLFLKIVLILMSVPVFFICVVLLPRIAFNNHGYYPVNFLYPALIILALSSLPYFYALKETYKLLQLIDENEAFSARAVKALMLINRCALSIGGLYGLLMPLAYLLADYTDAPGLVFIGLVILFACLVVAVFAATLKMLLENAIAIKDENDLTV